MDQIQGTRNIHLDKIFSIWIGDGLGTPAQFLADNWGEFVNEHIRSMEENLNIQMINTAGESSWRNELNVRRIMPLLIDVW